MVYWPCIEFLSLEWPTVQSHNCFKSCSGSSHSSCSTAVSQQTAAFIDCERYGIWKHLPYSTLASKFTLSELLFWPAFDSVSNFAHSWKQALCCCVLQCGFFSPCFVGVIALRHKVLSSYQQLFCVHTRTRHRMSTVYLHAPLSLRWGNIELCWPTGISRAELKTMSRPGSKGYPQRKTQTHTCVPGSHSWHEASAVSPFLWDFGFFVTYKVASLSYIINCYAMILFWSIMLSQQNCEYITICSKQTYQKVFRNSTVLLLYSMLVEAKHGLK